MACKKCTFLFVPVCKTRSEISFGFYEESYFPSVYYSFQSYIFKVSGPKKSKARLLFLKLNSFNIINVGHFPEFTIRFTSVLKRSTS